MTELNCRNCGAPLNRDGKCAYCGSVYRIEGRGSEVRYVEIHSSPVQTLTCKAELPRFQAERMPESFLTDYVTENLRHELAKGLMEAMKVVIHEDRMRDVIVVRGTVRVVPPDFRF